MSMNPTHPGSTLELGVIGNGTLAALIDPAGTIQWCWFPASGWRSDLLRLLGGTQPYRPQEPDNGGYFAVELAGALTQSRQWYKLNSAVLVTRIEDRDGNVVEITDFAAPFRQFDRMFRPPTLMRQIVPVRAGPDSPSAYVRASTTARNGASNHPRLQPYPLRQPLRRRAADHRCRPVLCDRGDALLSGSARCISSWARTRAWAPASPIRHAPFWSVPWSIGTVGSARSPSPSSGRRRSSAPP